MLLISVTLITLTGSFAVSFLLLCYVGHTCRVRRIRMYFFASFGLFVHSERAMRSIVHMPQYPPGEITSVLGADCESHTL